MMREDMGKGEHMNLGSETEFVEFKKSTSELKEGLESIASILNKHGHGTLYFGVGSDGTVLGQSVAESTLRTISQAVGNKIEPAVHPIITAEVSDDGKNYVKVEFSGSERPYSCDGRYRIRTADEDVLMSGVEVRSMIREIDARVFPWDVRRSSRALSDVDEATLRDYVKRGQECGRISFVYDGVEPVLTRLRLLQDDSLTNAAEVLFCESTYPMLKMGVLAGRDRVDILDIQQVKGTLFELARRAEFYILSNIRRRVVIDGSKMQREEVPELPMGAVREAIINGLAHRDYQFKSAMQIDIYADSVEIFNPGWFPEGQTPGAHLAGEDKRSESPNGLIAEALFRSKDIESYGSGLPRIKKVCDAAGIAFEYRKVPGGTTVVFFRNDPFADGRETGLANTSDALLRGSGFAFDLNALDGFTVNEKLAVAIVSEEGRLTTKVLASRAGISRQAASRTLKRLAEKGVLLWNGKAVNDPSQYYSASFGTAARQ